MYFEEDQRWLEEVERCAKANLSNNNYTIVQLAQDTAISERHLRRRMKQLLGVKPAQYLKSIRLEAAQELLAARKYKTITQVAHSVGFRSVDAFRQNYESFFGQHPKNYMS